MILVGGQRCLGSKSASLGDIAFEVLHLPGHSPDSIGLFDVARAAGVDTSRAKLIAFGLSAPSGPPFTVHSPASVNTMSAFSPTKCRTG